jgi:hypothetical protein
LADPLLSIGTIWLTALGNLTQPIHEFRYDSDLGFGHTHNELSIVIDNISRDRRYNGQ